MTVTVVMCAQVVSATLVPSPGGKDRCDLFVWDGSMEPQTLDTFADTTRLLFTSLLLTRCVSSVVLPHSACACKLPRWLLATQRGPVRRLTVWRSSMFATVQAHKWLRFQGMLFVSLRLTRVPVHLCAFTCVCACSAKMREGEIELMTHDVLSSVAVLDAESAAVTRLLTAAGCDVPEAVAYCTNYRPPAPPDARPLPAAPSLSAPAFRPQIVAEVEPAYRTLPLSTVDTVLAAAAPGLFRCALAAYALSPPTPSQARVAVCPQCQRAAETADSSSSSSARACTVCGTPLETRRVLQLRVGDRTGLLDVLLCDPPAVVCAFVLFCLTHTSRCLFRVFQRHRKRLILCMCVCMRTGLAAGTAGDGRHGRVELCARVAAAVARVRRAAVPGLRARLVHDPPRHAATQARRHRLPRSRRPRHRLACL